MNSLLVIGAFSPVISKSSNDIQQFQGYFRIQAKKKKKDSSYTLCVKVHEYVLSGKVFRITLG